GPAGRGVRATVGPARPQRTAAGPQRHGAGHNPLRAAVGGERGRDRRGALAPGRADGKPDRMSTPVRAKIDVPLAYDQRADAAAVAVLRRLLTVIGDNLEGSISGADHEHLHQLRIAVRRSRTVQRQLALVFPPQELPGFRSEFRWLQQATGDARDLDVYVDDLDSLRDLLPPVMRRDLDP